MDARRHSWRPGGPGGTQAGASRVAEGAASAAVVAGIKKPKSAARKPKWMSKHVARKTKEKKRLPECRPTV